MPTCIYHKDCFEKASGEHVLQNFLGARWTSDRIVCDALQAEFGKTIDAAFERGLRPIRTLLGSRGGRGERGPALKGLNMSSGERVDLDPGGRPRLAEPIVKVQPLPEGDRVSIQAGTAEQIDWAMHKLRQQRPDIADRIDPKDVQAKMEKAKGHIPGHLQLQLQLGGRDYFRGMLKSCINLLGATSTEAVLDPSLDPVRRFVMSGEGELANFVRFPTSLDPIPVPKLGQFGHFVGMVTRNGNIEGVVQLFGGLVHPFQLANGHSGTAINCGYAVDPTRESKPAEDRNPPFKATDIPIFSSQREKPDTDVFAAYTKQVNRFLKAVHERADGAMVNEIVQQALGPPDGRPITDEMIAELSQRLAQKIVARYSRRPSPECDTDGRGTPHCQTKTQISDLG